MTHPNGKKSIRLLAVGAGTMGMIHVGAWEDTIGYPSVGGYACLAQKAPNLFTIVGVCDADPERAAKYAKFVAGFQSHEVEQFTDLETALEQLQPDAVDLVVPPEVHHTLAEVCLSHGAHVLMEKPVALTVQLGQRLADVGREHDRIIAIAEQFRRSVTARTMHWAVNRVHLIGQPRMLFHLDVHHANYLSGTPWRHDRAKGGGRLLDMEVHNIDVIRYIFGEVTHVYAQVRNYDDRKYYDPTVVLPRTQGDISPGYFSTPFPSDTEDAFAAVLTFSSGAMGTYAWTCAAPGRAISVARYYGDEGCLDQDGLLRLDGATWERGELEDLFRSRLEPEEEHRLFPHGITDPVTITLHDFLTAVRQERAPEIDIYEGLRDQAVAQAILESAEAGKAVAIDDVLSVRTRTRKQ